MLVIVPILLLVSAFSFIALRHYFSLNENPPTLENQEQNLLQELKKEKIAFGQLSAKNFRLKAYLRSSRKRINKSFAVLAELDKVQAQVDKLKLQYSILKAENSALLAERDKLSQENEAIKIKLNSAQQPKNPAKEIQPEKKEAVKEKGNRGVLFKTKKPASAPRITIEVLPASSQK